MYLYTAQELQLMHEERVGHLTKIYQSGERKAKRNGGEPFKQLMKLLKREEA